MERKMKISLKSVWPVTLLAALSGIAQANSDTIKASALRDVCKNWADTAPAKPTALSDVYREGVCKGYMAGWLSGMEGAMVTDDKGFMQTVRFEEGVTGVQMAKVFVLYMQNHPEEENKPAHVALTHAMTDAQLISLVSPGKDTK
jgi:Rap1a immunity proteins